MKKFLDRSLPYLFLCACLLYTLHSARPESAENALVASALPGETPRFAGEAVPLRAYLPLEPVWHETLGLWKTHAGLDIACAEAQALQNGTVVCVGEDALWGVSIVTETEFGRVTYRSLGAACVQPGQKISAGALLGPAAAAPCEAELGEHVHIEYESGGGAADPACLLQ